MRHKILFTLLVFVSLHSFSQVGIGTTTPDASSVLHIESTNKGVLFPSMDLGTLTVASPVTSPAEGLVVWNTDLLNSGANKGLYYWDGSEWKTLLPTTTTGSGSGWSLTGNAISSGNFLGTTTYTALELRVNNSRVAYFHPQGGMAFGDGAVANNNFGLAIGHNADASGFNQAIALGDQAYGNAYRSVAIGYNTETGGNSAVALGASSTASAQNSIALGNGATASGQSSVAIGNGTSVSQASAIVLGNSANSNSKVGIGTNTPQEKLHVAGKVRIVDGTQGNGKVLTSDANGSASWIAPTDVTYFGEIRKTTASNISQFSAIAFGDNLFAQGVNAGSNNFQTQAVGGIYRVSYKVIVQKTNSGSATITFFLSNTYNPSGKITGSDITASLSNGDVITITGEKLVTLGTYSPVTLFCDTTNSGIQVLPNSTMAIEFVSE